MNKPLLLVTGLVLTCAVVTPKVITTQIEQEAKALTAKINDWPYYQASLNEVEAGWFSYQAKLKVDIDLPSMLADGQPANIAPLPLEFQIHSQQGPILASGLGMARFRLSLDGEQFRDVLSWQQEQPFYQIEGKLGFTGALSFKDTFAGFSYFNDQGKADIASYQGVATTKQGVLQYRGELASATFDFDGVKTELDQMVLSSNFHEPISHYFDQAKWHKSDFKLIIDNIVAARAQQPLMAMTKLEVSAKSDFTPEHRRGNMELVYRLKQLSAGSVQANDMELVTELANLNEAAFFGLSQVLADQSASSEPQVFADEHQKAIKQHLLALFKDQPELNFKNLAGTFPQGKLQGHLSSKLANVTELPEDLESPQFWQSHVQVDSKLVAAKELTRVTAEFFTNIELHKNPDFVSLEPQRKQQVVSQQVANLLAMLEAQGTLRVDGDNYILTFSVADGQALVNGQALPLGQ